MERKLAELNPFEDFEYVLTPELEHACIGNNTGISPVGRDMSIVEGFRTAAKLIIKGIVEDNELEDTCVYPLFFSCRHSIELILKQIIRQLVGMYKLRMNPQNDDKIFAAANKSAGNSFNTRPCWSFQKPSKF